MTPIEYPVAVWSRAPILDHNARRYDGWPNMANLEHRAILAKGAKEWNEWRIANAWVVPDLTDAALAGC